MPPLVADLVHSKIMHEETRCDCRQREKEKCSSSLERQRLWACCSQHCLHPLNHMIPTIIPTACKAGTTACRDCVSSQATLSARLRPRGHSRIVVPTPDLRSQRLGKAHKLT